MKRMLRSAGLWLMIVAVLPLQANAARLLVPVGKVIGLELQDNTVTVGPNEALFSSALRANNWNWFPFPALTAPLRVKAKARSRMTEQPATVYPEENGFARVEFHAPQRAVTPGQAVVLYQGETVIGGGTITEVIK